MLAYATNISDGLLPFAAKVDWEKFIVPLLFGVVWLIGIISQAVAKQQQEAAAKERKPIKPPGRPQQQASQSELDDFVRGYSQPAAPVPPPPPKRKEPKKPKPPVIVQAKPQSVESRHLHSQLESRHGTVMHSQLENRGSLASQAEAPTVAQPRKTSPAFAGLLRRGNLGPALILGQILASPPGMQQRNLSPLDPPVGTR